MKRDPKMTPPSRTIILSDPLTLVGRELLELLPRFPELLGELRFVHTGDDDEHQIAELSGQASLVPPLDDPSQLEGAEAVVLATDTRSRRTAQVEAFLATHVGVPVVDAGRLEYLREHLVVASPSLAGSAHERHVRVPHPALLAASAVISALEELEPAGISVVAINPVSELGGNAIETLAAQALERLQGLAVDTLLDDKVRAFNLVVDPDDQRLDDDLARLMPELETTASQVLGGCFHGHLAQLAVQLSEPTSYGEIETAIENSPSLRRVEGSFGLDATVGSNAVLVGSPTVSRAGRWLSLTCAMDGLRVGGALTALELLAGLLGPSAGGYPNH
jgi:aspartate-semialdehyde dehydrogenase